MTASPAEVQMHSIERTPEYEEFMARLREYHAKRGTTLDPEPKVGMIHLDLFKVFNHIVANGGYDKVSEEKLAWRRMAAELGLFSNNEASTAFSLKEKFYKNLAAFEISTVHGKEPPPKDILEDVTAKGASLLTRTRENFRGKRDGNVNATDSAASGDDGTPTRERPAAEIPTSSARASRGLREAPPQRVIFQPDTGSNRATRHSSNQQSTHAASPAVSSQQQPPPNHSNMQPMPHGAGHHPTGRGPSIMHHPPNGDNVSQMVLSYQPKHLKPLPLRAVATPASAPHEFQRSRLPHRPAPVDPANRQPMLPGTGFDGPNIYTRCLNALRSGVPAEQAFALNHLVKISYERGDKYRFDAFPGLAEGLVDKALHVGSLFYHVQWTVSWDPYVDDGDIGCLDGNNGTPDILDRIQSLVERDVPEALQTEAYADELVLITEAVLTIRNMVTLPENAHNMSDFYPLKDLVCIIMHLPAKDSLIELKHMALDIAEQLTPFMALDADDALYKTLLSQLASEDRGTILTALRALARISMNLDATNNLADVTPEALRRMVNWLLLNDDELIDACLDFLYQYTAVVPNLDLLVRSTTPENLVDHLVRLLSHGARKSQREFVLYPEQRLPARDEIAPVPEDLLQEMMKLEEPDRVHRWVKCFFDEDHNSFVTQLAAWQAYQSAFAGPLKTANKAMITPADFIRSSTSVYKNSNAQVLREPGEAQQKFIIHGIRARARPLSFDGTEYGRCLWATNPEKKNEKCGQFYLKPEQMGEHILTAHLNEERGEGGQFGNEEREFRCTWGECFKYEKATKMRLRDFARHINTHILALLPSHDAASKRSAKAWVVPAKTMTVTVEETMTTRDERNPNAPPQAAGIPLSAVLVLRNIARNVVKTEAEEELVKQQQMGGTEGGGWNERLFRPALARLFEILTENKALSPYIASLLDLVRTEAEDEQDDEA
ncbi:ARID/BRIGHT DNA binding domain-containing protein [Hirsutella rhossiliensis]|uniref:ARID/BRIGHT DNA binding domain-containing protein n=1 Tax=Hirsutella rhossiliensis TaxID=111463 RepID=A0A9P8MPI7_9HYPO|nr:ARID/BRIGHT DNA binding domain-containing protein [Hirsutella rhossiliensis]KAH0958717.1 ARID/BRIGHT DNA binding domain-containing protein [Hirsutella rhossiliensis]